MTAVAEHTAIEAAERVVAALGADMVAAYAIGSAATGGFRAGRSDLDLVVVLSQTPTRVEVDELVERARAVDISPAHGLELVLYAGGDVVLNLNTGRPELDERVDYGPPAGQEFWFVLDRAIAEQHAVPLAGPPWQDVFAPVSRGEVLEAVARSLRWQERYEPGTALSALSTIRAWRWLETGEWVSKREAERWLRARVLARIEDEAP